METNSPENVETLTITSWQDCFESKSTIPIGDDKFQIYQTHAPDGPLFVFHHGISN
jgi:hypothetical protein